MALELSQEKILKIAARYEVWGSIIQVQRWFKNTFGRNENLGYDTIRRCHSKLFESGSVSNAKRPKDLSKKRTTKDVHVVRRLLLDDLRRHDERGKIP